MNIDLELPTDEEMQNEVRRLMAVCEIFREAVGLADKPRHDLDSIDVLGLFIAYEETKPAFEKLVAECERIIGDDLEIR